MREDRRARIVAALLWLAAAAAPALAQEKALHWRALEVRARLDAQGRLEVVERHAMIFTGDWNGGERTFRLFSGQKLDLTRIARVDPQTGEARALAPGDLSQVDHYGWKDERTLRWRSRLPADPPYNNTEIVTELGYTLSGVLSKEGDVYVLDHDFAFPDRPGAIETFSLDLSLDPAWRPAGSFAAHRERKALLPGESDVVTLRLQYVGAGRPASLRPGASSAERRAVFFLLAASVAGLLLAFRRREAALGRLSPLISDSSIDARWLEANVFSLRPEEVGALWHESVGAPEVAALLARLTADGKIQTRAEGKKMTLKRLVAPEKLEDYERKLLVRLFFGDREETDTDAIRAHYRSKGFDPAALIRPALQARLNAHREFNDRAPTPSRRPTVWLLAAAGALASLSAVLKMEDWRMVVGAAVLAGILLIPYGLGLLAAASYRKRIDHLGLFALTFLWVPLGYLYLSFRAIGAGSQAGLALLIAILLVRVALTNSLFNMARTREGPGRIARRKALAAARRYFKREMADRSPRISHAWYPYILALDLGPAADRWQRSPGPGRPIGDSSPSASVSFSGSSSSSEPSGGWAGGGGSFGGAGASASWAAAAGALAAGVSAPGSSGGGGGGGGGGGDGGGGSSGGGGGGGW